MESHLLDEADEVTRYDELRKKNLEDNKLMLKKLMLDANSLSSLKPVVPLKKAQKRKSNCDDDFIVRRNPARSSRANPARFDLPYTRSRSGSVSSTMSSVSSSSSSTPMSTPEKLVVRFGFFKSFSDRSSTVSSNDLNEDDEADDDDYPLPQIKRKPRKHYIFMAPEEVTQAHLDAVAVAVSDKKYDSINGTSCHQCRQKTDDMKTMCRSSRCLGVRGQFCGPCLKNRYGEDAKVALKDPDWECPPCRGICNCSFCRKKSGRSCTGILIHIARDQGFSDVSAYLSSLQRGKDHA